MQSVPYAFFAENGITPAQALAIEENTKKSGTSPELITAIEVNTAKVGITTDQAAAITANTAKVGVYIDDSDNTVAGRDALSNKSGLRNTAFGKDALRGNKDGTNYLRVGEDTNISQPMYYDANGNAQIYGKYNFGENYICLLYTSPSPRDKRQSRMPSSA